MKHYVYRITNLLLKKHYYGTRTSKIKPPAEDIGYIYFSSSSDKEFINDQKANPQNYKYKVIKIFDTRKEAMKLEIRLHSKFEVGLNEKFYNRAKATSTSFDPSGRKFNHKKSTIEKIRSKAIGRGHSEETKNKLRKHFKGKSTGKNLSKGHNGANNSSAIKINIFNNYDELMFECHGNFIKICEDNDLPKFSLRDTYVKETRLYSTKSTQTVAKNNNKSQYIGWYARKVF